MSRSLLAIGALLVLCTAQLVDALLGRTLFEATPVLLFVAASAYAVGRLAPRGVAGVIVVLTAAELTWAGHLYAPGEYPVPDDFVFYLFVIGGPAFAGAVVRSRAAQVRELRRLAGLLGQQREAAARAAELQERNRVEIGMHRGFSEQIAAIVMRMEGANGAPAEERARALTDVEATSRRTLEELRQALGTLRDGAPTAIVEPESRSDPSPGGNDWRDGLVALGCGGAVAIEIVVSSKTQGPVVANVLAGLLATAPLTLRRTRPVLAMVGLFVAVAATSHWLTPWTSLVTPILPMLLAAYSIGAHARSWQRYAGLGIVLLGPVALIAAIPAADREPDGVLPTMIWLALAFAAGVIASGWSARAAEQRRIVTELERGRDVHVQRAVEEERSRLAQELHDTLAHSMTVICLQASAGQVAAPANTEDTVSTILSAARTGLAELRDGLDQLDQPDALDPEEIRARARAAGLRPEVRVAGDLDGLPPDVRALAGRLVREALVNAGRYAPGSRVVVTVDGTVDGADRLRIGVLNEAAGGAEFRHGAGTGLQTLTEHVARAGGVLEAGPHPGGGWLVSATLPLQEVLV